MQDDFMNHCQFCIDKTTDKSMVLFDMGPWDVYPTLTNDVEWVVAMLGKELKGRRLYYYDSEDGFSEIVYEGKIYGEGYIFSFFRDAKPEDVQ